MTVSETSWFAAPVLPGNSIRLDPLTSGHAEDLLQAADDEVFRWLTIRRPRTTADAENWVSDVLSLRGTGERIAWVHRELSTGLVAGTTSFHDIDPSHRSLAIGHTWIGRRWWNTAVNSEAKFLMLTRAFETLDAVRVVWHTDILNLRSQQAIERLGAVREGVLRKHRLRPDGSWRDTVQYSMTDEDWPVARERLHSRLARDHDKTGHRQEGRVWRPPSGGDTPGQRAALPGCGWMEDHGEVHPGQDNQ